MRSSTHGCRGTVGRNGQVGRNAVIVDRDCLVSLAGYRHFLRTRRRSLSHHYYPVLAGGIARSFEISRRFPRLIDVILGRTCLCGRLLHARGYFRVFAVRFVVRRRSHAVGTRRRCALDCMAVTRENQSLRLLLGFGLLTPPWCGRRGTRSPTTWRLVSPSNRRRSAKRPHHGPELQRRYVATC